MGKNENSYAIKIPASHLQNTRFIINKKNITTHECNT